MADVETIRTMAAFVTLLQDLRDDKKLADTIKTIAEQSEAAEKSRREWAKLRQEAQELRDQAQAHRAEVERVTTATKEDVARRETELATAYKFQIERDEKLKAREDALAKRTAEVKAKDDGFSARERIVTAREMAVAEAEAKLKARFSAFEKKRAALKDMAEV